MGECKFNNNDYKEKEHNEDENNDNDGAKCEDVPQTSSQGEEKQDQRRSAPQTRRPSWFCDRTSSPFLDLFFPGRLFHVADDLVFFTETSLSQSRVSCH